MRKRYRGDFIITGYIVTMKDRRKNLITYARKLAVMEGRIGIEIASTRENIASIYKFI